MDINDTYVVPEFKQASHMIQLLEHNVQFMFDVVNFAMFHPDFEQRLWQVKDAIQALKSEYINNLKFQRDESICKP